MAALSSASGIEGSAKWDVLERLIAEVEASAPLVDSFDHGSHHWRLVGWVGSEILKAVRDADPLVVFLFALFHDSQRENEWDDPEHGPRGAGLARQLIPRWLPELSSEQLDVLCDACALHTEAGPTEHATLGTCWDSDRLNLWRVGTEPNPRYLSTKEAKRPERIEWANDLQSKDFEWTEIWGAYETLG